MVQHDPLAAGTDGKAPHALAGEVAFASPEVQVQRTAELLGDGAIVVTVPPMAASMRGRLAEHVEECVERELAARGAPAPYLVATWDAGSARDVEGRLSEQLFRARTLGASGIAIALGSLVAAASPALAPEDSSCMRTLARAAASAPLVVMLDDADATLMGYSDPVPIAALLACAAPITFRAADTKVDAPVAPIAEADAQTETKTASVDIADALASLADDDDVETPREVELTPEPVEEERIVAIEEKTEEEDAAIAKRAATAGIPMSGPNDFWRTWAVNLASARGPQPLSSFQRLFVESYMPLAHAIAQGVDDPRALRAHDEFRRAFERAYTDAFATFGVTNRRPRLVMDAHDWAMKQARLHNARAAHVLIVDSLRCDLAWLVRDAFAARSEGHVSLTSETILFAALPTTTHRQLETIARGIDALRAPAPSDGAESLRGRAAETVRRMRCGSRELYKLDIVPAMLGPLDSPVRGGSEQVIAAFDDVAESVAEALAKHTETLAPRTLLLVAGDHGFQLDRRGRITTGGASPEEVLVPALAYLVGDLH